MSFFFFFNDTATTEIYTLSLHDALPICRGDDDCDAVEREGEAALFGREGIGQDPLGHGLQSASARSLEDSKQNDRPETGCNTAQQRAQGEDRKTYHEEPFASQHAREPSADGQHDRVRNQIGSEHPGALVGARTKRSEEHTSELQSLAYLVCRLLLEKKKNQIAR